jgi:hypothetical protein
MNLPHIDWVTMVEQPQWLPNYGHVLVRLTASYVDGVPVHRDAVELREAAE